MVPGTESSPGPSRSHARGGWEKVLGAGQQGLALPLYNIRHQEATRYTGSRSEQRSYWLQKGDGLAGEMKDSMRWLQSRLRQGPWEERRGHLDKCKDRERTGVGD